MPTIRITQPDLNNLNLLRHLTKPKTLSQKDYLTYLLNNEISKLAAEGRQFGELQNNPPEEN